MRKFYVLGTIAAACLAVTAQAWAGTDVGTLLQVGPNNIESATNREYLIDRDFTKVGSPGFHKKGQIDVGDAFRGELNLLALNSSSANVGGTTGMNELTGVFQVEVLAKVLNSGGTFTYVFGPDSSFVAPGFAGLSGATGLVAALYTGTPNYAQDFNDKAPAAMPPADSTPLNKTSPIDDGTSGPRTSPPSSADVSTTHNTTEESFIATAMDGTPFLAIGFTAPPGSGNGEGIACTTITPGLQNVLPFFTIVSGSSAVLCNLNLNVLAYGPGFPASLVIARDQPSVITPGTFVDFDLQEALRGVKNLDTAFEVASLLSGNFDTAAVPEPGTLLLFGSCLLGLGIALYRKK